MIRSIRDRKRQGADRLFGAVPTNEIMGDLVDTVQDKVLLERIRPNPNQPRQSVDEESAEFQDLVGSIRQQGLIQPISLWQPDDGGEYVIIAGERRWRAFRHLAKERPVDYARIPATVTRLLGGDAEARALMMGIIENVVRDDLKDGERADALARLRRSTGWTFEQIGERMGMDVGRVQALASIARHEAVKEAVNEGTLTQKQAVAIGQGIPEGQPELAAELVAVVKDLNPPEARAVVRDARSASPSLPAQERAKQARAAVLIGSKPAPRRGSSFPVRQGNEVIAQVTSDVVVVTQTALRVLRPKVEEMEREAFAVMLQEVCQETNIWPRPVGGPSE